MEQRNKDTSKEKGYLSKLLVCLKRCFVSEYFCFLCSCAGDFVYRFVCAFAYSDIYLTFVQLLSLSACFLLNSLLICAHLYSGIHLSISLSLNQSCYTLFLRVSSIHLFSIISPSPHS